MMARLTIFAVAVLSLVCFSGCAKYNSLYMAVAKNDISEVQNMINSGTPVDSRYVQGATALMAASIDGNLELAKYLISRGANVNSKNDIGLTPLNCAAIYGRTEVARLLIEKAANLDDVDINGDTPLMRALFFGQKEVARLLIEKGSDVNRVNVNGDTPLSFAAFKGQTEAAKLLMEKGATVSTSSKNGSTPLILAVAQGNVELARLFIAKGADVTRANQVGDTALSLAAFKGLTETAKLLIEKGAKLNTFSKNGSNPLGLAAANGNTELVRLLIANGADAAVRGEQGKTALEWARERKHTETCQVIEEFSQRAVATAINEELEKLLAKNDQAALKAYLDEHPNALSAIKNPDMRLSYTGPAELRVIDIAQMIKNGSRDSLLIAQINSVGGPYKKFTVDEFTALKKMKISDEVVAAMIAVTTAYNKEQKLLAEQKLIAEQKRNQASQAPVKVAKQAAPQPVAVQQPARTEEAPNTLVECVKLAAALKSCDLAGGFFAMGCKAVARSQFNCPSM